MPVYLFTYHAYRSWLPDHPRGFVDRQNGVLPPDPARADRYRARAADAAVEFDPTTQRLLLDEAITAAECQLLRLHAVACEPTHVHLLTSWSDARAWELVSEKLKGSLTRRLNRERERRRWFSRSRSRRRVRDRGHFDHLATRYLPSHGGLFWREGMTAPVFGGHAAND